MKNFDWTKFKVKIAVKAPMEKIYRAWAVPAEIEKWFLERARYFNEDGTLAGMDKPVTQGMKYNWSWYLYDILEEGFINIANGTDHIRFTFAGDCLVDVRLSMQYEYTIIELEQSNIPVDDESKKNIRLGCHEGWSFYLVNLKSIYEGGHDLRATDTRLQPMLNN